MNIYDYYINFQTQEQTKAGSIGYLNKIVYVALSEENEYAIVYSQKEVEELEWLYPKEKEILSKAFSLGLSSLYIRGAKNNDWGKDQLELSSFKILNDLIPVDELAYTLVISPLLGESAMPLGFNGVLVLSVKDIPQTQAPSNVVWVYDPLLEKEDPLSVDGKALGIMALFLSQSTFNNMQLTPIKGYNAIAPTGLVKTLKDLGVTFIFNDGYNDLLGMFSVGGKAIIHPYLCELWRYNVREALRGFLQVKKPTYINENIEIIETLIDGVCDQFVNQGYFERYEKTIAPLRDEQLASDIDRFLVNNVTVKYQTSGAIWGIDLTILG